MKTKTKVIIFVSIITFIYFGTFGTVEYIKTARERQEQSEREMQDRNIIILCCSLAKCTKSSTEPLDKLLLSIKPKRPEHL